MAITRTDIAKQLLANGGRIGLQGGGKGMTEELRGPISEPEYDTGLERQRVENMLNEVKSKDTLDVNEVLTTAGDFQRIKNAVSGGGIKSLISPQMIIGKLIIDQINKDKGRTIVQPAFAEGGPAGGIMDLETGRQMYGLGKLVKKITRGVKKIVKSPIGKAALFAAPFAFSPAARGAIGSFFGKGSFNPLKQLLTGNMLAPGEAPGIGLSKFGSMLSNIGLVNPSTMALTGKGITSAISAASLLPLLGIGTGDETEDEAKQLIADNTGLNFDELRPQGPLRFAANGGLMRLGYQEGSKEPVAKETMPLLDMGGKEMDLREDGGFVPIGRMEKADDVPARLSKNEFVFTAEAVRNAGDGDIDKGSEVMYNMMKNLESGGDVSEESQGLEGARKMFQTSQRLEEVL